MEKSLKKFEKLNLGSLQKFRQNVNLGEDSAPEERSSHRPQFRQPPYNKHIFGRRKILLRLIACKTLSY